MQNHSPERGCFGGM